MPYSKKFTEAFLLAEERHHDQTRKGIELPYITHLMAVAAITAEHGGDEEMVIAALCHDLLEDTDTGADEIAARFGARVAKIVKDLSDTTEKPKPHWRERKEKYLRHLKDTDSDSLLVSCADKLHNAGAIIRDVETVGDSVWKRFNAPPKDLAWYYESLAEVFLRRLPGRLSSELAASAKKIGDLAREAN